MDTLETAKQTKTAYFIEYVYPIDAYGKQSFYFQLERTKDCAILYANENINNVFIACWKISLLIARLRKRKKAGTHLLRCKQ